MLDVRLARHLLEATAPGTRLWLVGDAAQLPPVGPGRVLADVIAYGGVPVVTLDTVQRQAAESPIVRLAHAVHKGTWPCVAAWRDPLCRWIETDADGAAAAAVLLAREARARGEDLQVLTAMRKGPDGAAALNAALRDALNPGPDGWRGFRVGDRVIQTRNNRELDVVNGEQGVVLETSFARRQVVVEFDGRPVIYEGMSAGELDWAYAITVHKAQGSEWPAVALVLTRHQYIMARRELLYTAITRAKRRLILIGDTSSYRAAVNNVREQRRESTLFRHARSQSFRSQSVMEAFL
jgi:exodeoxyribonuclease V alpha subunit